MAQVETAHGSAATEGQSSVPDLEESVTTHFIAFTHVDGSLYELDGRKDTPINHGPTTGDTLLEVGRSGGAPPGPAPPHHHLLWRHRMRAG